MAIILKPIVTEKMTAAGEKFNRYGFQVVPRLQSFPYTQKSTPTFIS